MWNWIKKIFSKNSESAPIKIEPAPSIPQVNDVMVEFVIKPSAQKELDQIIPIIKKNIDRYKSVEVKTSVPWDVLAACHYREASLNFNTCLHNGDPLPGPTRHVPKGRGPFSSWEEAAVDSMLDSKSIYPKEWSAQSKLDFCEAYNGLGYKRKGLPSPYVWAGTNHYQSGLYVADGKFDGTKVDQRLGCAAIIKGLA